MSVTSMKSIKMSRYFLFKINNFINRLEFSISQLFGKGFPPSPEALCVVGLENSYVANTSSSQEKYSIKDLIGDGFLWAVPKHRRSVEKRLNRRFGHPDYVMKILKPKAHLRTCNQCGHDYEVGVLCPHCYEKVKVETEAMQQQIQKNLGLDPVDKEVIVLYEGEKEQASESPEFFEGKRIVEMSKPRPQWFSKNLLQKSTQLRAKTKEVDPNQLG